MKSKSFTYIYKSYILNEIIYFVGNPKEIFERNIQASFSLK